MNLFKLWGAPTPASLAADGHTAFGLDLYAKLKGGGGNLFFSPYSVSTCLGMVAAGARGDTEAQMSQMLHFSGPQAEVHARLGALQKEIAEGATKSGVELRIANGLWAQEGHAFLPEFLKTVRTGYEARLERADFRGAAEETRGKINHWVAEQTKDKIQDLLPAGSLTPLTRLVLVNAIYFKGAWLKPFEKAQTTPQPFYLGDSGQTQTPLMHHTDQVKYMETGDLQAVELPYRGGRLAMVVALPRQRGGVAALEGKLTPAWLRQMEGAMEKQRVEIFLPRFKLEYSVELKAALEALGAHDAFSPKADFSGMDATRLLYVSGVYHKAWVEVGEEGTEAAAATGAVMALRAAARPVATPVFRADHPFVFFIRDTVSGSVLFLGRVAKP